MNSYFWFTIFKDMDTDKLIILFIITFTVYIISTYYKFKLEEDDKSDESDNIKSNDK